MLLEKFKTAKQPEIQALRQLEYINMLPLATCIAKAREALASGVGGRVLHAA